MFFRYFICLVTCKYICYTVCHEKNEGAVQGKVDKGHEIEIAHGFP